MDPSPHEPTLDVSIIAVLYNNRAGIEGFVRSARSQIDPTRGEIILVDNGSVDGSVEFARTLSGVRVLENGLNAGYGVAMNRGIRQARGRTVLLASDDIQFRPGAIDRLLAALAADPGLGAVGPAIEVPQDGPSALEGPPHLYPVQTTDPGIYYGWNFFSGCQARFAGRRLGHWCNRDQVDPRECGSSPLPWLHGCCTLYRRAALAQVGGGFDERFFMYFEDSDLGRCLRAAGWRLRLEPSALVFHQEHQPARQKASPTRVYFMQSYHAYLRKHRGRGSRAVAFGVVLGALIAQLAVQGVKACLGRPHGLGLYATYLRTHLEAPWRDLVAERAALVRDQKRHWQRTPDPAERVPSEEPETTLTA